MFIDLSKRLDEVVHENDLLDLSFSVIINLVLLYKILSIECDELFHIKELVMTRIKMIGLNIFSHIRERFGIYTKDDLYNIFSIYYERDPLNIIKEHQLSSYARDNLYPILDTLYTFYLENSHDIS
jgi:hypothetical protein